MSIIFLGDGAMQDKAGAQIDDLVKHLRNPDKWQEAYLGQKGYAYADDKAPFLAANALESQSAELTRLRERNAELEKERDEARRESVSKNAAMLVDASRIASLEAQLEAFRVAAKMVECERSFGGWPTSVRSRGRRQFSRA